MKRKALLVIFLSVLGLVSIHAQVPPTTGFPNLFGNFGQAQQQQVQQQPPVQDTVRRAAEIPQDKAKLKKSQDLELDNKIMQLKTEQILLKEELAKLQGSGDTTRQDSVNITIKKKNLELLYLKEQLLLKSELEKYGFDNNTLPLPVVFGQEYFRNPRTRMLNTPSNITPSESYILGSGDQIQVDVWGRAGYSGNYTVDGTGFITIPKKQKVFVSGKSLSEVRSLLRARFQQIVNLSGSSFNVSVSNTRSITVHVTGEVFYPGTYTLSALNSAFNILSVAGGPTNMGSLRNVLVQRGGKVVDTFDLYKYLFGGKDGNEIFLQNNDYLIVPTVSKLVDINGGMRRQGKFELKGSEGYKDLMQFAGGFATNGFRKDIVVKRIVDHSYYNTFSFNWDSISKLGQDYMLVDGDILYVKSINSENLYLAKIKGGVKAPGSYKVAKGERLNDIIKRAGGLHRDAYMDKGYLIRTNSDLTKSYFTFKPSSVSTSSLTLEANDEIIIFTKDEFVEVAYLSSENFVRNPIKIEYIQGLKASDLIKLSGGITDDAYNVRAIIERTNSDFTKTILPVDLSEDGDVVNDVLLERNDILRVYDKPAKRENYGISIYGEVNKPAKYQYFQNVTLKDLIIMAGGIKQTAEFSKIEIASVVKRDPATGKIIPLEKTVIRTFTLSNDFDKDEVSKTIIIQPMDRVFVRKAYFNEQEIIVLGGEVKYPGAYAIASKNETLLDVVERAGGFTEYAFLAGAEFRRTYMDTQSIRVIVNLKKAQKRPNSRFNYFLADADSLNVPRIDQTVRITGSIENQEEEAISSYHIKGKRAKHYIIHYAGGFAEGASRKAVYVKLPNGQNVRTKNFLLFKVYPKVKTGSIIYVPNQSKKKGSKFNLDGTLTKILTTTTTALTLIALINLATGR
ncbi:SLBB domain-containing protein [Bacteroidia bacterium]|nr:SLBB domain-containing protein [Bacteroidia bacterium]